MNSFFSAFTGSLLCLMIVSCAGETVDYSVPPETPPEEPTPEETVLPNELPEVTTPGMPTAPLSSIGSETIAKFNEFSLNFFLANSEGNHSNLCVSPFSVGAVLGMIANGDDGASRDSILKMMGFEQNETGLKALNTYYQTLLSNFPNIEEDIACEVTNTLWCDPLRYRIRKTFMDVIADCYYAYGIGISPKGEAGRKAVNEFVDKNTKGLIKDFLTTPLQIDLAFLNTLYFKAGWSRGFEEWMTQKGAFLDIDGKEQQTDFMRRYDPTGYGVAADGTEAIRLNYGANEQFSMTCILPSSGINHVPLDEVLNAGNINAINESMKNEYMFVRMPKFEIETNNANTIDILGGLGLDCGKFSMITDSADFLLNAFIHATKIKVDENGTEGTAVSFGGMEEGIGPGDGNSAIPEIVFDRPFIFYIQENTTGVILFIGAVKTFS